ncbi:MAG: class I SAM-dependent methyltransferase [Kiritimatiellae bacterium]|nr:class I SAM-dependent methyltransferase [Kiritimatiellia bacterium]MDD4736626.1 class I SAM-dependent methyltransferase [Kiritimatiellia bacterium]
MNPFVHSTAAQRYAQARPYYHPVAIGLVKAFLPLDWPVRRALDVACGTGLSCVALKELAGQIVGTDNSLEMIAEASSDPAIQYLHAPAEDQPFPNGHFDLITVSSAFHWFDRVEFLAEANRLLPMNHWLVIYTNWFEGKMKGNPKFGAWMKSSYLERYPCPPRHWSSLTEAEAETGGFCFVGNETYSNDISFTIEGLTNYLTTQSNIIAAVEDDRESLSDVRDWLKSSFGSMFGAEEETFDFGGTIWYLKKKSNKTRISPDS